MIDVSGSEMVSIGRRCSLGTRERKPPAHIAILRYLEKMDETFRDRTETSTDETELHILRRICTSLVGVLTTMEIPVVDRSETAHAARRYRSGHPARSRCLRRPPEGSPHFRAHQVNQARRVTIVCRCRPDWDMKTSGYFADGCPAGMTTEKMSAIFRIMLDWKKLPRPIVALAPMADMTDPPFCRLCREVSGDGFVIFREMVSSEAVVRENPKTLRMCDIVDVERPIVQQIFGSDPATVAEAARLVEERFRPDAIDINMGCPATKIVSNFDGASLMRDPNLAASIVRSVKAAVTVPVSVKTRLGWTKPTDIVEFIKVIEDAGADLVTVHGRTKSQGYAGSADWEAVGEARSQVKLPVIVNGDIVSTATAKQALLSSVPTAS